MFETRSDCRVLCPALSARLWKTFRDDGERDSGLTQKVFAITPEWRSPSTRNYVRSYPGIAFGCIPERRSASSGIPNNICSVKCVTGWSGLGSNLESGDLSRQTDEPI